MMSFLKTSSNWVQTGHTYWIGHWLVSVSDIPPVCDPFPRISDYVLQTVVVLGRKRCHLYGTQNLHVRNRFCTCQIQSFVSQYKVGFNLITVKCFIIVKY